MRLSSIPREGCHGYESARKAVLEAKHRPLQAAGRAGKDARGTAESAEEETLRESARMTSSDFKTRGPEPTEGKGRTPART
jgi:hypothetical protein